MARLRFLPRRDRPGVLYVIQHHDWAGAEVFAAAVMRADADPLLACPPGSGTERFARAQGIPVVPLPYRPLRHSGGRLEEARSALRGLLSARDLRLLLAAHPEREIVYCTSLRPGMLAALGGLGLRRRRLWVITDFLPPPPLRQAVRLLARAGCEQAAATSHAVAADFGLPAAVVHPGVDTGRFAPAGRDAPPRAAIVGGISPTKRTDLAVDIAARVSREVPAFELRVVGRAQYRREDFELEQRLHDRVAEDPLLGRHVTFAGHMADVPSALADCRLLLHCRADEPFGVVLVEAMACGLPVVAPRAAGPLEIVQDGLTGLLYEPGDAEDAARQVVRLTRDPGECRRMGEAGRRRVERLFAERRQVERFDALLAGLATP